MPTDSWIQKAAEEIARGMVRHLPGCMGRPLLGEGMGPCDPECAAHRAPALVGIAVIIQRHDPAHEPTPERAMPPGWQKYRKRAVVIDAAQWFPPGDKRFNRELASALGGRPVIADVWVAGGINDRANFYIETLESNRHTISPGDFIIRGVKGEYYACKPDIFAQTYDLEPDTSTEPTPPEHWCEGRNAIRPWARETCSVCREVPSSEPTKLDAIRAELTKLEGHYQDVLRQLREAKARPFGCCRHCGSWAKCLEEHVPFCGYTDCHCHQRS